MCGCKKVLGILLVVFGILFLLQNLNVWAFWGIQWYTVAFVLIGVKMMCKCKECCEMPMKKK